MIEKNIIKTRLTVLMLVLALLLGSTAFIAGSKTNASAANEEEKIIAYITECSLDEDWGRFTERSQRNWRDIQSFAEEHGYVSQYYLDTSGWGMGIITDLRPGTETETGYVEYIYEDIYVAFDKGAEIMVVDTAYSRLGEVNKWLNLMIDEGQISEEKAIIAGEQMYYYEHELGAFTNRLIHYEKQAAFLAGYSYVMEEFKDICLIADNSRFTNSFISGAEYAAWLKGYSPDDITVYVNYIDAYQPDEVIFESVKEIMKEWYYNSSIEFDIVQTFGDNSAVLESLCRVYEEFGLDPYSKHDKFRLGSYATFKTGDSDFYASLYYDQLGYKEMMPVELPETWLGMSLTDLVHNHSSNGDCDCLRCRISDIKLSGDYLPWRDDPRPGPEALYERIEIIREHLIGFDFFTSYCLGLESQYLSAVDAVEMQVMVAGLMTGLIRPMIQLENIIKIVTF